MTKVHAVKPAPGVSEVLAGAQFIDSYRLTVAGAGLDALDAARFYAATFPDSKVTAVHHAPSDYPSGRAGDVLTVEFTVLGIPCLGLNGGPGFPHSARVTRTSNWART